MTITLTVQNRTEKGKRVRKLRESGRVPAVVYGPKEEATSISIEERDFEKAYKEAGESSVLVLSGLGEDKEVLIHDVSFDAMKGKVSHVDFYIIKKGQDVTVSVPLVFVGEAPAIKLGGSLTKALHELEVTGKPSKLPHEIEIDISSLATFEDHIRVKDISLPSGLTAENDPEETVAVVSEVKEEPEEEAPELDMEAIEVEKKGKEEEEEG
ncbi:MAG: 50S ribosomal protein L25 [Candidatus Paceibacterota bacterium]